MTFARILETGSGRLAARLMIEGIGLEFVSEPEMERSGPTLTSILAKTNDSHNLLPAPGSVTWFEPADPTTITSGQADPGGGTDAWMFEDPGPGEGRARTVAAPAVTPTHDHWISCFVKKNASATHTVRILAQAEGSDSAAVVRIDTGEMASITPDNPAREMTSIELGGWWLFAFKFTADAATTSVPFNVYPAFGTTAGFPAQDLAATGSVTVYGPRIADATVSPGAANPLGNPLDRDRVYCFNLADAGLVIDEAVNIPEATLESPGTSVRLFETRDERLAQIFCWRPDVERRLTATIATLDGTLSLLSTTGIDIDDIVHVGTEAMRVTGRTATTLDVTRAIWSTIRQKHWSGEAGIAPRALTNRPLRVRGRRAYLYLYGDGDDLQGDGTRVWTGHVSGEPAVDDGGTMWRLQLAGIAERIRGKVGGELERPPDPRGIYYSFASALHVRIREDAVPFDTVTFTGFFDTQIEFCDALTDHLAVAPELASAVHTYRAVPTSDGSWTIAVTLQAALTPDLRVIAESAQDGTLQGAIHQVGSAGDVEGMVDEDGNTVETANAGDIVFTPRRSGLGTVPRGYYGYPLPTDPGGGASTGEAPTRLYIRVADDCDRVQIEWPHEYTAEYGIIDRDSAAGWVELHSADVGLGFGAHHEIGAAYTTEALPIIRQILSVGDGTIADMRDGIVADGPEYCNLNGAPFLTDADLADWSAVVAEAARGRHWLLDRRYTLYASVDIDEWLQHEMRLYGLFPVTDEFGRIDVRSIAIATSGGTPVDIDEEMVSVGWSQMQRGQQTVNRVTMRTGYDPREDDWIGGDITVQNMDSYAQDHEDRSLDIEPRSTAAAGDSTIDPEDAADVLRRITDLFGFPHDYVTVNVSWKRFGVLLGDPVLFSADHLPDYLTGARPTSQARGIVVGRRWRIGEAHGQLRLLVHGLNTAGYSPTARITSHVNTAGNDWTLGLDDAMYAPPEAGARSFWAVGDAVRIVEYDSDSPTVITGEITALNAASNVFDITLDGVWTPGSATWELCYDAHGSATSDQRQYAYIAGSDGLLDGENPRVFAP